jgi:hypothetical protein
MRKFVSIIRVTGTLLMSVLVLFTICQSFSWAAELLTTSPRLPSVSPTVTTASPMAQTIYPNITDGKTYSEALGFFGNQYRNLPGVFADSIVNSNLSAEFRIPVGWTDTWSFGIGALSYTHTYGTEIDWSFKTKDKITYTYKVPFNIDFYLPKQVYPGQKIILDPRFFWGAASLTTTHDVYYEHTSSGWADAPFDGLDDFKFSFNQQATKAVISGALPVVPIADAINIPSTNVTVSPFDTGVANYGGSYTKLGGHESLVTAGNIAFNKTSTEIYVGATGTSGYTWQQGHEQFELTAYVLSCIPYTTLAGQVLNLIRKAGDLKFITGLHAGLNSEDIVNFSIAEKPSIVVPSNLTIGSTWTQTVPVTIRYWVNGRSAIKYPGGVNVTFAMRGINEQTIWKDDLLMLSPTPSTSEYTGVQLKQTTVMVSVSIPVIKKELQIAQLQGVPTFSTAIPQPAMKTIAMSPLPTGVVLINNNTPPKIVRTTTQTSFPRPTVNTGIPQMGQYAVVLGQTQKTLAEKIVNTLQSKGIIAFIVQLTGTTNVAVTLGSCANNADATMMAGILREVFKIDGSVVQVIDPTTLKPVDANILVKLQAI